MALFVRDIHYNEIEWHVPFTGMRHHYTFANITSLQADGDELEFIKKNFNNIPMALKKRVVTWFGSDAQFIAKHLE